MFRKSFCVGLMALLLSHTPVLADTGGGSSSSGTKTSSSTKRVVWTLVGIGAGFGAGLFIGLDAFDDSINSDRKVWTSALAGAVAGGVAAALLSRNAGRVSPVKVKGANVPHADARLPSSLSVLAATSSEDDGLRRRVRAMSLR